MSLQREVWLSTETQPVSQHRIFIVDDDPDVAEILSLRLKGMGPSLSGASVSLCKDLKELEEKINEAGPNEIGLDIFFVDMRLKPLRLVPKADNPIVDDGDMGGIAVVEALHNGLGGENKEIIVYTASDNLPDIKQEIRARGVDRIVHFLSKRTNGNALPELMRDILFDWEFRDFQSGEDSSVEFDVTILLSELEAAFEMANYPADPDGFRSFYQIIARAEELAYSHGGHEKVQELMRDVDACWVAFLELAAFIPLIDREIVGDAAERMLIDAIGRVPESRRKSLVEVVFDNPEIPNEVKKRLVEAIRAEYDRHEQAAAVSK